MMLFNHAETVEIYYAPPVTMFLTEIGFTWSWSQTDDNMIEIKPQIVDVSVWRLLAAAANLIVRAIILKCVIIYEDCRDMLRGK